ncbi:MAG: hypothetical protein RLZ83_1695 [Pseudomonadota bacterium]|jgi:DNA-binding MarR family transcriptional regulator
MTRPLRDNLSYRLSMVGFLLGRRTSQLYAEHGLTVQQWKVLSVVFHHAPMPAVEIERWVTLDKAAISRAVAQLLRAGLVERRLRATDGRRADILLTDSGRVLSERISAATAVLQDSLMQALPPAEQRRFFGALDAVEAALRLAEVPAAAPQGRQEPPS